MEHKMDEDLMSVWKTGHPGTTLSIAQFGITEFARFMQSHRKVNSNAGPKNFARYQLTMVECAKRGVRFLPAQVMRPIFAASNL